MVSGVGWVMDAPRPFRIVQSASAADRLDAAASFLRELPPYQPVTMVAASRGAADDLARRVALERGATIGLARYSLTQIAARAAATRLTGRGVAPATALGSEAIAARACFDALRDRTLTYFGGVARAPGFPRALAHTLGELRTTGVPVAAVAHAGEGGKDLAWFLAETEQLLIDASVADRTMLLAAAAEAAGDDPSFAAPLLLLDVAVESPAEEAFIKALAARAQGLLATAPAHDDNSVRAYEQMGGTVETMRPRASTDLENLREYLFADAVPPPRELDGSLIFFSAPGEGRESVEIARRVLDEARRGVRFDEMAIFIRAPQHYQGLIEHALERARVPAWFDRGIRRPHPAGRAFLALMACAEEGLSARRFAEYLSLGQLPNAEATSPGGRSDRFWTSSGDEVFAHVGDADDMPGSGVEPDGDGVGDHDLHTLPTPRRWERMLVEAAVIGGGPTRWARRLDGLAAELDARLREVERHDESSPRAGGLRRDLDRLARLRAFALPLIEEMAAWPVSASWGEWLDVLEAIAPRVLRVPAVVIRVLADLRPMGVVGPVTLAEVRAVLSRRLLHVETEPPARRYGRVFVGGPEQARGRAFKVVFLPGLAERMFPQKPRQDPLLPDAAREQMGRRLSTLPERGRRERLLLHLAVGSVTERLYVSYPRLEVAEGRGLVPSFYALDVLRGATGRIPDYETLAQAAAEAGDPALAWPAPREAARAIDDQEHDLSVLRELLDVRPASAVRGHAQYMIRLNPGLRRSVTERWARGERQWTPFDGLVRVVEARTLSALTRHRLGRRAYSLSALQQFASCPYKFLLGAIYRLEPAEQPQPLQRLDPLTKGSLVHRIQAVFLRELDALEVLPVSPSTLDRALVVLEKAIERVADEYREQLAPAIDRVWQDEIAAIARDLRGWVRNVAGDADPWIPRYFELAFGLRPDPQRDPRSVSDPVTIDGRFVLHGAVDLVEEHPRNGELRVTDHKTGKDRTKDNLTIGGGEVLQPVLYSMAVEQVLGKPVSEARLYFCTSAGAYRSRPVRLTPEARRMGVEALEIIDRSIETGFLAASPAEGACAWCDFRPVCGPNEEARVRQRKPEHADLRELRSRP
jgi:CRISPR/Cas system-associated exonuclease Cas4 (RecB family)